MAFKVLRRVRAVLAAVLLIAVAALSALPAAAREPGAIPVLADGVTLGDPAAPVTLQAYLSFGCPHCQAWYREVFPVLKKKYIDTGKVRLVVVEFTAGHEAMARAGAIAARCAPPKQYFKVAAALFDHAAKPLGAPGELDDNGQPRLDTETWTREALKTAGVDARALKACDAAAQSAALDDRMGRAMADYPGYEGGTPSFVANGQEVEASPLDWAEYAIAVTSKDAGHPLATDAAHDLFCVGALHPAGGGRPQYLEVRWSFERGLWRLARAPAGVAGTPVVHGPDGILLNDGQRGFLLGDDGIPRLAEPGPDEAYDGRCGMLPLTPIPK